MNFELFKEFGLLGLVMGAVIFLLYKIVMWTLATTKDILLQAAKERECWHAAITNVTMAQSQIVKALERHDEKAEERGKYTREEHKEMIDILGRINGFKHE